MTRGGRATIVVEPPTLPLPGVDADPRQDALAAVLDELIRLGVPDERHTILVAGGLERRGGRAEQEAVLRRARARAFRGTVVVHDCSDEGLRALPGGGPATRIGTHLLDTDLVVTVTAAETVDRGGATALLGACDADTIASPAPATSLLEPASSPTRSLAAAVADALAPHVPCIGVSVVLDHPRLTGRYRGYPWSSDVVRASSRSAFRPLLNTMPGGLRRHVLQRFGRELRAAAVLAGPPSVAHAEALLRGIALRGTALDEPLDTIVVPVPWKAPHQPRAPLNPITVAATALGIALRLWREHPPSAREARSSCSTISSARSVTGRRRRSARSSRRSGTAASRGSWRPPGPPPATTRARSPPTATGRAPHPLLPFVDWESAAPAARPGRDGDRGRLPRRGRRPGARLRPEPQRGDGARDGARSGRRRAPARGAARTPLRAPARRRRRSVGPARTRAYSMPRYAFCTFGSDFSCSAEPVSVIVPVSIT